jgi:predicted aspartyl protease
MGQVIVSARIENVCDLYDVDIGTRTVQDVRFLEIADALVDPTTIFLSLPTSFVRQLGLTPMGTRKMQTSRGLKELNIFGVVRLTVKGRDCTMEVAELPDSNTVVIGRLSLLSLDFVVDPIGQRLLGNPDHGGEHMMDLF